MKKSSVYLFYGNETFLIQKQIDKLTDALLPLEEKEFNVITYDLADTPVEEVIQEAETLPFLSEHKLVIAKNADLFTAQKGLKKIEHQIDSLETYLNQPAPYSTVIFWTPQEKLDERKKIVKQIKQKAYVQSFSQLTGKNLLDWVKESAMKCQVTISDDVAANLIHRVGQDLSLLSKEIEKMALFVGKGGAINERVVEELAAQTLEQNVFSLIEQVVDLQIEQALKSFYDLLKNNEEPIKINTLFARQFRLMLYTKELYESGYSEKQIASQLGAHPYSIKIARKQSERFDKEQLQRILQKLAVMDYEMKSGLIDKTLALEMFMLYIKKITPSKA